MKEPDMEAIAALKPDLIIASHVQHSMLRNLKKLLLLSFLKQIIKITGVYQTKHPLSGKYLWRRWDKKAKKRTSCIR